MNAELNEHHSPSWRRNCVAWAGMLVLAFSATAGFTRAEAVDPPQPDFFWPYGRVSIGSANAEPQVQQVIALVNGKTCGETMTKVVEASPGVPPADVGATVYVVDVLANGQQIGQRPGCGNPGDPVMLYFVGSKRIAQQQPLFMPGSQRVDVDLGSELAFQLVGAMVAGDGTK